MRGRNLSAALGPYTGWAGQRPAHKSLFLQPTREWLNALNPRGLGTESPLQKDLLPNRLGGSRSSSPSVTWLPLWLLHYCAPFLPSRFHSPPRTSGFHTHS
jgi:hypothetical protein